MILMKIELFKQIDSYSLNICHILFFQMQLDSDAFPQAQMYGPFALSQ